MQKKFVLVSIIAIGLVAGGCILQPNTPQQTTPAQTQPSTPTVQPTAPTTQVPPTTVQPEVPTQPTTPPPTAAKAQTFSVNIVNFAFSPSNLTINKGDTVVWTNSDSVPHPIVSDSGSELSSQTLNGGATYSHKFNTAGTFSYHCSIHPSMTGTITVQ